MTTVNSSFCFFILCALLAFTGCQSSGVSLTRVDRFERAYAIATFESGDNGLAVRTTNYLNGRLLAEKAIKNPTEVLRYIEGEYAKDSSPMLMEYLTDISARAARNANHEDDAIRYWISTVIYAQRYVSDHLVQELHPSAICDPGSFVVIRRYNTAVMEIFEFLKGKNILNHSGYQLFSALNEPIFFNAPQYIVPFNPEHIKEMEPCAAFKVNNLSHFSYWYGVGVPMIATADQHNAPLAGAKSYSHITYPITMLIRLDKTGSGKRRNANLFFISPYSRDSIPLGIQNYPLEMDFSTPLAAMLTKGEALNPISYTLNPMLYDYAEGLYFFDHYDPKKIPVVFVHGLLSSPSTWIQMINTLKNDKRIRDNYQFWMFTYSSGRPVITSAQQLRSALDSCYQSAAPDTAAFDKMVLVGHSMGGLITRTLISDCDSVSFAHYALPNLDTSKVSDAEHAVLHRLFDFGPRPYIKRAVFMATPHRGSDMATWTIARIGAYLINLPTEIVDLNASMVARIRGETNFSGIESGVENLSPKSPFLKGLNSLKIKEGLPVHSIVGNNEATGTPGGTDGIVPYESAHLDAVESELVVESGHSVQVHPLTILEMQRILWLHLKQMQSQGQK